VDPLLRDEVVALRPWRDADVPAKFRAFSDPETQRFSWPEIQPYSKQDAWATHHAHKQAWEDGTGAEFACVDPHDDERIIGGASVYDIEHAWAYFRAIGEPAPVAAAIEKVEPGEGPDRHANVTRRRPAVLDLETACQRRGVKPRGHSRQQRISTNPPLRPEPRCDCSAPKKVKGGCQIAGRWTRRRNLRRL